MQCPVADTFRLIPSFSAVGQMPFLDFLLDKNPIMRVGPPNLNSVAMIALGSLGARQQGKDENFDPAVPDLMQHFIGAKAAYPDLVDDNTIMGYMPPSAPSSTSCSATRPRIESCRTRCWPPVSTPTPLPRTAPLVPYRVSPGSPKKEAKVAML
jgi:hypothetical protein